MFTDPKTLEILNRFHPSLSEPIASPPNPEIPEGLENMPARTRAIYMMLKDKAGKQGKGEL